MTKPVNTLPRLYSSRKAKKSAKAHKSAKVTDTLKHSNRPKALKLAEARGFISHIFLVLKAIVFYCLINTCFVLLGYSVLAAP